jgi:hypothetical protein
MGRPARLKADGSTDKTFSWRGTVETVANHFLTSKMQIEAAVM